MQKAKRAVVFGVFDRLHPGHLAFLAQARAKAGKLMVIIARDESVTRLKGREPREAERMRAAAVRKSGLVSKVFLGDRREGEYRVLQKLAPDLVVLGYDQKALAKDIRSRMRAGQFPPMRLFIAKPYLPERWHTRLLTKK